MFKPKMFTKHCPESLEESDNTEGFFRRGKDNTRMTPR